MTARARLFFAALVAVAVATGADVSGTAFGATGHAHPAAVVAVSPVGVAAVAVPHRASGFAPAGAVPQRPPAVTQQLRSASGADPAPRATRVRLGSTRTTRGPPRPASSATA